MTNIKQQLQEAKAAVRAAADETSAAYLLAIVAERGPIIRGELVTLAVAQSGRSYSTCSSSVHKLLVRGLLECERRGRRGNYIREPATMRLAEVLGGTRMPACIPEGRVIRWEQEESPIDPRHTHL